MLGHPMIDRRLMLFGTAGLVAATPFAHRILVSGGLIVDVTEPSFAADPSGRRNSTQAFAAASAVINEAGGGTLVVPEGTYRVGKQTLAGRPAGAWSYAPEPIISIQGCSGAVNILGEGARLVAEQGLRFGSFDPVTGRAVSPTLPFTDPSVRASPYLAMIDLKENTGPVHVAGFDLDGNQEQLAIGGGWNDHGIQIPGSGIEAYNNAKLTLERITAHNQPLDGIMIGWDGMKAGEPARPHTLIDCVLSGNARQGLSWVGGNGLVVRKCRFVGTGRGRLQSAPSAGLDVEAENAICTNASFEDCEFSDNSGVGLLVHRGQGLRFDRCRFIGTTNWAAWPAGPDVTFHNSIFVGGVTNAYGDKTPSRATRFLNCRFTADRDLAPRGQVYSQNYLTVEMGAIENVRFEKCQFDSGGEKAKGLIFTNGGCYFDTCRFHQDGPGLAVVRGTFIGRNVLTTAGKFDFSGARFANQVMVNGTVVG